MISMNVLQQFSFSIDFSTKHHTFRSHNWKLPLTFQHGHAYDQISFYTCYKNPELRKWHKHFMNPSPDKLFHLIKCFKPENGNPHILKLLQQISAACEACTPPTVRSFRFCTTVHHQTKLSSTGNLPRF